MVNRKVWGGNRTAAGAKFDGPLIRLQIDLAELDATSTAAALTLATERPLTGQPTGEQPAIGAAVQRPDSGPQSATTTATSRPSNRPTRGQDTAAKVAKTTARHPDWSAAQVAAHLSIGERTARRHMTGH